MTRYRRRKYQNPNPGPEVPPEDLQVGDEVEIVLGWPEDEDPFTCPGVVIAKDDNGPVIKLLTHRDPETAETN